MLSYTCEQCGEIINNLSHLSLQSHLQKHEQVKISLILFINQCLIFIIFTNFSCFKTV